MEKSPSLGVYDIWRWQEKNVLEVFCSALLQKLHVMKQGNLWSWQSFIQLRKYEYALLK